MTTTRERIAAILGEVLHEAIKPDEEYTRSQSGSWDSLNHLRIILAFEEEFGVSLEPSDVIGIRSLSDLVRIAERGR
jgi:acyl carrier protein